MSKVSLFNPEESTWFWVQGSGISSGIECVSCKNLHAHYYKRFATHTRGLEGVDTSYKRSTFEVNQGKSCKSQPTSTQMLRK